MKKDKRKVLLIRRALGLVFLLLAVYIGSGICHKDNWFPFSFSPTASESAQKQPESAAEKAKKQGHNLVDYSVIDGTVTTVSSSQPGQAFLKNEKELSAYKGELVRVQLPESVKSTDVLLQDDYMKKTLKISIPAQDTQKFTRESLQGSGTNIRKIVCKQHGEEDVMTIHYTKTYAFHYCIQAHTLLIKYGNPADYYEHIVVIDPGHGGVDTGSYTWNKSYMEKKIINKVSKKVQEQFAQQDKVMVYYTRTEDSGVALADRIGLANDIDAQLFFSIHCNFYQYGNAYGVETAYNSADHNKPYNSKWFAKIAQDIFPKRLQLYDRGILKYNDLKVLRMAQMPACLLEMGFISDPAEAHKLSQPKVQKKAAVAIYDIVMQALDEMEDEHE